jgi:hypothetical protein
MRIQGRWRTFSLLGVLALFCLCQVAHAQLPVPVFGQHWDPCADDLSGYSHLSPSPEYGSLVTSIAMVLRYYGLVTDPGELHTWLSRNNFLLSNSDLWNAAAGRMSGLTLSRSEWQSAPADLNVINAALDAGYPVIAEVRLPYNDNQARKHYVVLTGHSGTTYFMNDPWYGDASTFNDRYHEPGRYIYGIRIYRGTPAAGTSPHGFPRGDAAWWADWEAHWNGWELAFPSNAGSREPWRWYDLLAGVDRLDQPQIGAIVVFQNAPNGGVAGTYGHVGYVIAVNGSRFRVRHSNWGSPAPSEADFEMGASGAVRLVAGKPSDPPIAIRGFLAPSGQPADRPLVTAPPPLGSRCTRRVLIVSSHGPDLTLLKQGNLEVADAPLFAWDLQSRMPDSLDGYHAVLFTDVASVKSGAGEALANFVQKGGGLVVCGSAAAALARETNASGRPWMGLQGDAFSRGGVPTDGIPFPSPLLGTDLGADRRWMPIDQANFPTLNTYYAKRKPYVPHPWDSAYAVCYIDEIGKGRFVFLSSCDNLDLQPVLRKALIAGLRWVMLE